MDRRPTPKQIPRSKRPWDSGSDMSTPRLLYGRGLSEGRLGHYFTSRGEPSDLVLSTKVGRVTAPRIGGSGTAVRLHPTGGAEVV